METRRAPLKRVRRNEALAGGHANRVIEAVNAIGTDSIPDISEIVGRADDGRFLVRITEAAAPQTGFRRAYGGVVVDLKFGAPTSPLTANVQESNPTLTFASDDIPLYERSGNSHVPIDGTALVWATPSDYGDYLLFDWHDRPRWASVGAAAGSAYAFTEIYPSAANTWATLPNGETGTTTQNPLREINGRTGVPSGTRVRFWRGFSSGAAYVDVQRVRLGDGGSFSEQQSVAIVGAVAGTFVLSFEGEDTAAIAYNANAAAIEAALEALSNITNVIVTGTGTSVDPFVIEFADDTEPRDILQSDGALLKGDQEWLFEAGADGDVTFNDVVVEGDLTVEGSTTHEGPVYYVEQGAPSTPSSGFGVVYVSVGGLLFFINDAGTSYQLSHSHSTGTTGVNFNISVAGGVVTFNLPDASATARGAVTTGSQTFAGAKTFNIATTHVGGAAMQEKLTHVPQQATLNTDQTDYALTSNHLIVNATGDFTFNGFVFFTGELTIANTGTGTITVASGTGAAANQVVSSAFTIAPGEIKKLFYDLTDSRWRQVTIGATSSMPSLGTANQFLVVDESASAAVYRGGTSDLGGATTLAATDKLKTFRNTSAVNYTTTLPTLANAGVNWEVRFVNDGNNAWFIASSEAWADSVHNAAGGFTLYLNETATVRHSGAGGWAVFGMQRLIRATGVSIGTDPVADRYYIVKSASAYTDGFRHTADTLDFRFLAESATIGEGAAGSWSGNRFSIFTDSGRRLTVHENNASGNPGNITVATASNPTGPTPCLLMAQAAGNITGIPSNSAGIVALDVAGTCELYAFDEAGNHVQQTRHAKDAPAALYEIAPGLDEISRTVNPYPIDGALWGRPGEVLNGIVYWVSQMRGEHSVAKPKWMVETFDEYAARMGYSQAERERRGLVVRTWADDQEAKRIHRENERAEWVHDSQNWMREEIEKELMPDEEKDRRGIPRDFRRRPFPKQRPEPYVKKPKPPWER